MPKYGTRSAERLSTCHKGIQRLFNRVVEDFDCSVLEGHRGEARQNQLFNEGKSKLEYPHGKHNRKPSEAIDVAPYPIDWDDLNRFYYFAGYVKALANEMGLKIRWGGDWDGDTILDDQTFMDLPHFEILT